MASWTTPTTHATGDILSVSDWNAVANNEIFLYQAPYCKYYNSVLTAIGLTTAVTLGGTSFVNYGFSVSSNTVVAPLTGTYYVSGLVTFNGGAGTATTTVATQISQNGTRIHYGNSNPSNVGFPSSTAQGVASATAGNYWTLQANNTSGSTLNTLPGADTTNFTAFFIGSQ